MTVIALLVFVASSVTAAVRVPEWVESAAAQQLPSYPEKTIGAVLLDETIVTATNSHELRTVHRLVYKILGTAGRDLGVLTVLHGGENKLRGMRGWSIAASGKYQIGDRDAVESAAFDGELYADQKLKSLRVPAAEPGSVVAFEYEMESRPYGLQDVWSFQTVIPVRRARYVLTLPEGWKHESRWVNAQAIEPQRSGASLVWEMNDVPAIEEERGAPPLRAVGGYMGIALVPPQGASHRTWGDVAKWFEGLAEPRRAVSPAIELQAKELTASASTTFEKIAALARFAQRDVRYVAIAIGIGSHQPHAAEAVLKTRYGDCKDKVTLLSSMLRSIGVGSRYVLVHTDRGVADDRFPSLYSFNHAIVAIDLPADAPKDLYAASNGTLFFDPTDPYTPLGLLPTSLQGSRGLIVPGASELATLPVHPPESSRLVRTARLKLGADGALGGEVREVRTGALAARFRSTIAGFDEAERRQFLNASLASHLDQHSIRDLVIENADEPSRDLVVRYTFDAPKYARSAAGMTLLRPRVLGSKPEAVLDLVERKQAYMTDGPSQHVDDVEIVLPAGISADELPPLRELSTPAVVYSSGSTFEKSTLRYQRKYEVRQYVVPREALAELNKVFSAILADERVSAVFK